MSQNNLFLDQNQSLTLNKDDEGLQSLVQFFDVVLQHESFQITNGVETSPTADQIKITGQTNNWKNQPAVAELIYTKTDGENKLKQIRLTQDYGQFDLFGLPGVTIERPQAHASVTFPDNQNGLALTLHQVSGLFDLGNSVKIPFKIINPFGSGALTIETDFDQSNAPGLTDLVSLFGTHDDPEQDLSFLPESLRDSKVITLREVALKVDPNADVKLQMIDTTIDFAPGHLWHLVPGISFLALGELWFELEVDSPLEPDYRFPLVRLGGVLQIGEENSQDGRIDLLASWPDWSVSGGLEKGSQIKLSQLLQNLTLPADQLPQNEDALVIDQLRFGAKPRSTPKEFSLYITIEEVWKLKLSQNIDLDLKQVSLGLNYKGQTDQSSENGLTGQFSAKLGISTVDLSLLAAYSGASVGWTFSGQTGAGQQIQLGEMITNDLAPKFGGFRPPAPIAGLVIENLSASFNTASKDFSFSGETLLPISAGSEEQIDFTLKIDLKSQTDGGYSKRFEGVLKLALMEFDVLFDLERQITTAGDSNPAPQPADSQTFLATFQNPTGRAIAIDDLLSALGYSNVTTGLEFTIKTALLAYKKTSAGSATANAIPSAANGKWLFGIDIEAGLNLSAIHIDDLPFVSIPPNQTLKLDFQVLAASMPFTQVEVDTLGSLTSDGLGFPSKQIDSVDLNVTLDFGTGSKQIDLPIGMQTNSGGNGLVPSNQANAGANQSASGVTATSQDGVRWINLQKQLGPLAFERVGVKYADSKVTALLDASFAAGGLTIGLNGLSMSSPLTEFNPTFGLDGLGIDFKNASVEIGGTFLKEENGFAGMAVIKTPALSLSAIGAYAYADGEPSLFIYAVLDYPLGGPAFFYVTGVAAGFGYNRRLLMPGIEQVASFPLVLQATGNSSPPPTDQAGRSNRLQTEIWSLNRYIPIENGQYFMAVGLKFTSFKQIDSFALLVVQFGNKFEIDLLGLSTLKVPGGVGDGAAITPVAEAQLALKAVFIPSEGFLGVRAQLTSNSYILSRACRLTGGFAFYSWFKGEHAGDFVLTLGGYHPNFKVPAHYPQVPRLGFAWRVSDNFYLRGELYFALTANALMAGGRLDALFQTSNIKAWFIAGADFLIAWKPYHYEISVFVSLGLEVTFSFFGTHTIGLSASAGLKLWGPEFGGEAHIKVKVLFFKIPVDITFGSQSKAIPAISFAEFEKSYLPAEPSQMCSVTIQSGLLETVTENGEEIWIVNPKEMAFATNSTIPSDSGKLFGSENSWSNGTVGVQPMGVQTEEITTTHEVVISGLDTTLLKATPIIKKVPSALWGQPETPDHRPFQHVAGHRYIEKPQLNGERFVEDTLAGFEIKLGTPPTAGVTHPISKAALTSEIERLATHSRWQPVDLDDSIGRVAWDAAAASDQLVHNPTRNDILKALGLQQLEVDFGEPLMEGVS
jgi:hypothetical protein